RILAAHVADDPVVAGLDADAAADRAAVADGRRGAHVPGPGGEAPVHAGQRPHRAELHDIALEPGIHRLAVEGADDGVDATVEQDQLPLLGDLVEEAHAALAEHAALHVQQD